VIINKEMNQFSFDYKHGYLITTLFTECKNFLPFLMKQFKNNHGKILMMKVKNFQQINNDYDLIINCSWLGAKKLISNKLLKPVRGQILRINAPFIKHAILTDKYYIITNSEIIIFGGSKPHDNWNTSVDIFDREFILDGCKTLFHGIAMENLIKEEWVGLRPFRETPRVQKEIFKFNGKNYLIIHNYGHGGSGVTIFRGCAKQVFDMVKEYFEEIRK